MAMHIPAEDLLNRDMTEVAPCLDVRHAIETYASYGGAGPTLEELRDISDSHCRLMMDAKGLLWKNPYLLARPYLLRRCIAAFNRAILRNAQFVATYRPPPDGDAMITAFQKLGF